MKNRRKNYKNLSEVIRKNLEKKSLEKLKIEESLRYKYTRDSRTGIKYRRYYKYSRINKKRTMIKLLGATALLYGLYSYSRMGGDIKSLKERSTSKFFKSKKEEV